MDLGAPQCFICVNIPDAAHHILIEQQALNRYILRPDTCHQAGAVQRWVQQVPGDVGGNCTDEGQVTAHASGQPI